MSILKNTTFKIKPTILMIFFLTVAIIVGTILTLQYKFSNTLALNATQELFDNIASKVAQKVNAYDKDSEYFLNTLNLMGEVQIIPKKGKQHKILPLLVHHIEYAKYIYAIYIGDKKGNFYEIINLNITKHLREKLKTPKKARWLIVKIINQNGKKIRYEEALDEDLNIISTKTKTTSYNPSSRPWFKKAQTTSTVTKTRPYIFSNLKAAGVTYAKTVSNNSDIVIGLDISLESLTNLLAKQKLVDDSSLVIFRDKGEITAFYSKKHTIDPKKTNIEQYYPNLFLKNDKVELSHTKVIEYNGKDYFKYTSLLESKYGFKEYLGIVSATKPILQPYNNKILTSMIASIVIFVFIAIPLILYAVGLIVNPIHQMEEENEKIKQRKFDEVVKIESFIDEIDELSTSMVSMSESIKEYQNAQKHLLDSFVKLIAQTIDTKSKYTGGHCKNVPELSLMIMQAASDAKYGEFKEFTIETDDQLRELSIAAWLHDCGKVTTPEYVVDKATKLETKYNRIHEIRTRFEVLYRDSIIKALQKELNGEDKQEIKKWLDNQYDNLTKQFKFIADTNIGGEFMSKDKKEKIKEIAQITWIQYFDDRLGLSVEELKRLEDINTKFIPKQVTLLSDKKEHLIARENFDFEEFKRLGFKMEVPKYLYNLGEIYNLCVEKGTLTKEERFKINEHVIVTIQMLEHLPFPEHLKNVPLYAGAHHETLDGKGYPRGLTKEQTPLPARIIALADIFEALSASDRPYNTPKKLSQVIKILSFMVKDNHIDKDLFKLLLESGIYKEYAKTHLKAEQIDEVDIKEYI